MEVHASLLTHSEIERKANCSMNRFFNPKIGRRTGKDLLLSKVFHKDSLGLVRREDLLSFLELKDASQKTDDDSTSDFDRGQGEAMTNTIGFSCSSISPIHEERRSLSRFPQTSTPKKTRTTSITKMASKSNQTDIQLDCKAELSMKKIQTATLQFPRTSEPFITEEPLHLDAICSNMSGLSGSCVKNMEKQVEYFQGKELIIKKKNSLKLASSKDSSHEMLEGKTPVSSSSKLDFVKTQGNNESKDIQEKRAQSQTFISNDKSSFCSFKNAKRVHSRVHTNSNSIIEKNTTNIAVSLYELWEKRAMEKRAMEGQKTDKTQYPNSSDSNEDEATLVKSSRFKNSKEDIVSRRSFHLNSNAKKLTQASDLTRTHNSKENEPSDPQCDDVTKESDLKQSKSKRGKSARKLSTTTRYRRPQRKRIPPTDFWRNEIPEYRLDQNGALELVRIKDGSKCWDGQYLKKVPLTLKILKSNKFENSQKTTKGKEVAKKSSKKKTTAHQEVQTSRSTVDIVGSCAAGIFLMCSDLMWAHESAHQAEPIYRASKYFHCPYLSTGILDILPHETKPPRHLPKETLFFFVHSGSLQVRVMDLEHPSINPMDSFVVPAGQSYTITNDSNEIAHLFFVAFKNSE